MTESQAREAICRVGKSLFDRGYVHGTSGNISLQIRDGFLITPTDVSLGYLDPAKLAKTDATGQQISGDRASKTLSLHRRIYTEAEIGTKCVIHTHSSHCVALSLIASPNESRSELLPALTPYFVMKVGHVPLLPYQRPGASASADAVAAAIRVYSVRGTPIRAVMLARLGPNVWHTSPEAAMATLEELEETAKLWLECKRFGGDATVALLDDDAIENLRTTFGARW